MTQQLELYVVDDEPVFCHFIAEVAKELGFTSKIMSTAKEFMVNFEERPPDVAVIDIVMPDVDGIELVNWLRKQNTLCQVLFMTGYAPSYASLADTIAKGHGFTSLGVILKPLTRDIVLTALKPALTKELRATEG